MPRPRAERWKWIALTLVALVPRAAGAFLCRPWHDEYFTAWASRLPLTDLIAALRLDSGPPLPYLLVKLVAGFGLEPVAAARAISVAAGTAAVGLAALASRRAFGVRAGWWTGALLAVHPLAVAWSCEGRGYALVLLAAAWAWERVEALAREGHGAVGLAFAVALACWSHGLGPLLAVVVAAAALTLPSPFRLRALAAAGAGLASHLPWLPVALSQPPAAIAWMTAAWRALPFPGRLAAPVRLLSPAGAYGGFLDLPSPPGWVEGAAAVLALALLALGCRAWVEARRPLLGFALPAAALAGLATLGVPALYPGRGDALYLAPVLMILGAGAVRSPLSRAAASILVIVAASMTGWAIVRWAGQPPSAEQRLTAELRRRLPEGGTVVVGGYWRLGIAYNLEDGRVPFELVNYPASAATHPGWYDPHGEMPSAGELERLDVTMRPRAARAAVIVAPGLATAPDLERLAAALGLSPGVAVPGARLLVPPPEPRAGSGPG